MPRKPDVYTPETKHLLIPPTFREFVRRGQAPCYVLNAPDYDRVPIGTFLVITKPGTEGLEPKTVLRVVKPNDPAKYAAPMLTPGRRLLYACWRGGMAVKSLQAARRDTYRHVVMPGEEGHDMLAAFKVACDTRRAWAGRPRSMTPTLLCRALGIEDRRAALLKHKNSYTLTS